MPKLTKRTIEKRQKKIDKALALRKEGWGLVDIARKVKMSYPWVHLVLKDLSTLNNPKQ